MARNSSPADVTINQIVRFGFKIVGEVVLVVFFNQILHRCHEQLGAVIVGSYRVPTKLVSLLLLNWYYYSRILIQ